MNVNKSEIHAWGNAPQASIFVRHQRKLFTLSTFTAEGEPRTYYKYLGVFFFTSYSPQIMLAHHLAVGASFFASLPDMLFSPKEATRLVNTQLVPKLAFRITAHSLGHDQVVAIQNRVWAHYSRVTKLHRPPPLKARFAPSQEGALGLFHLPTTLAALVLAQYQRVLHSERPTQANSIFLSALRVRRGGGGVTA